MSSITTQVQATLPLIKLDKFLVKEEGIELKWYTISEDESVIEKYIVYGAKESAQEFKIIAEVPPNVKTLGIYRYDILMQSGWGKIKCYVVGVAKNNTITCRSEILEIINTTTFSSTIFSPIFTVMSGVVGKTVQIVIRFKTSEKHNVSGVSVYLKNKINGQISRVNDFHFLQEYVEFTLENLVGSVAGYGTRDLYELHVYPIFKNGDISAKVFQYDIDLSTPETDDIDRLGLYAVWGKSSERGVTLGIKRTDTDVWGIRILCRDISQGEDFFKPISNGYSSKSTTDGGIDPGVYFFDQNGYIEVTDLTAYGGRILQYSIAPLSSIKRKEHISSFIFTDSLPPYKEIVTFYPVTTQYGISFSSNLFFDGEESQVNPLTIRGILLENHVVWDSYMVIRKDQVNANTGQVTITDGVQQSNFSIPVKQGQTYVYRAMKEKSNTYFEELLSSDILVNTKDLYRGTASPIRKVEFATVNALGTTSYVVVQVMNDGVVGINYPKCYRLQYMRNGGETQNRIHGNRVIFDGKISNLRITPVDLSGYANVDKTVTIERLN